MRRLLIWLIRLYQKYISAFTPPCCKYYPTCSSYGVQAISRFGAGKGTFLTVRRILRCNPFSSGGYDPVPDRFKRIDYKKIKSEKVEFGE